MINFPIAIVLYNPPNSAIERILNFLTKGLVFYIFDNSKTKNEILSHSDNSNLSYYSFEKNFGLSYSINYICEKAIQDNNKNLLFFDQDTIFKIESLTYIHNFLVDKENDNSGFFGDVLSVNFRDSESSQNDINIIETGIFKSYFYYSVYFNINSGTLYFLDHFKKFKWFEEQYFVDGVDYSLSLNTIINNLHNIVIVNVPGLNHKDEQGDSEIQFLGRKISGRAYPLSRNYDFLKSHMQLLLKSLKIKSFKPKLFIIRAMFSYSASQFIFRVKDLFAKTNKT